MNYFLFLKFFFSFFSLVLTWNPLLKINDCKCSIRYKPRIIGGSEVTPFSFPWQVSIRVLTNFICGGTIINARWILTGAHCLIDIDIKHINVQTGLHELDKYLSNPKNFYFIKKVVIHPNYVKQNYTQGYDVGLLKVNRPIIFSDNVQPACLTKNYQDYTKGDLFITGWGSVKNYKVLSNDLVTISNNLRGAKVNYVNPKYASYFRKECANNMLICGYPNHNNEAPCKGDSGGPLHYPNNGFYEVVGISSFVYNLNSIEMCYFSVYTRISYFIDFIHKNVKKYCRL